MRAIAAVGLFLGMAGVCVAQTKPNPPIDRLLNLLRERLMTAKAVAMVKFNSGAPVEDKKREEAVIAMAVKDGKDVGVKPELIRELFTAQIESGKAVQRALIAAWTGKPKFAKVPNLAKEVRPKLDGLTDRIVFAFHVAERELATPEGQKYVINKSRNMTFESGDVAAFARPWILAVAPLTWHK